MLTRQDCDFLFLSVGFSISNDCREVVHVVYADVLNEEEL